MVDRCPRCLVRKVHKTFVSAIQKDIFISFLISFTVAITIIQQMQFTLLLVSAATLAMALPTPATNDIQVADTNSRANTVNDNTKAATAAAATAATSVGTAAVPNTETKAAGTTTGDSKFLGGGLGGGFNGGGTLGGLGCNNGFGGGFRGGNGFGGGFNGGLGGGLGLGLGGGLGGGIGGGFGAILPKKTN